MWIGRAPVYGRITRALFYVADSSSDPLEGGLHSQRAKPLQVLWDMIPPHYRLRLGSSPVRPSFTSSVKGDGCGAVTPDTTLETWVHWCP